MRKTLIDGVIDLDEAQTNIPSTSNLSRVCVGCSRLTTLAVKGHFAGDIALVSVYNRALSTGEVMES